MHAPVWRYLYTHRLDDPNWSELRSAHVLEDPLLWGYDVFGFDLQVSPAEQVFSGQLADYWTNFAKTGNPNGADLPAWPSYDTNSEATLSLGEGGTLANYHAEQCAFVDTIEPIPYPWSRGNGPGQDPMGFWRDHAMG